MPEQKSVPVTGSNTNKCVQTIYIGDPADGNTLGDPTFADVGVTFTAKAFPQPHLGDPIQLTGANLHITVAAAVLQAGVDQKPPLITDGMPVPSTLAFTLAATNTSPATHTWNESKTQTVHVTGGKAQPLAADVPLGPTTWTPVNKDLDVRFFEKSMDITAQINILGGLTVTFQCNPNMQLLVSPKIGAHVPPPPETTTVAPPVVPLGTTSTVVGVSPTSTGDPGSGSLPRTGASWVLLFVIAAAAIDLGIVMIGATRRRFRHR